MMDDNENAIGAKYNSLVRFYGCSTRPSDGARSGTGSTMGDTDLFWLLVTLWIMLGLS